MEEVQLAWESLQAAANGRKRKLRASSELQKFLSSVRDLISWMHDTSAVISTVEPARSVSGAEALLAKHSEYKAEIDAREESVAGVNKGGKKLIQQGHYASTEIRSRLSDLKRESGQLQQVWLNQKQHLDQMLQLQFFLRDAKNIDAMSGAHEVHLSTDKLGLSVDECDALLKKHEAFERLIISQEEKVMAMNEFAERLCEEGHYERTEIQARRRDVLQRRSKVKDLASERRSKLEDCRKLMVFLQNCSEAESWINEKLQVANDESFRDPTNLENKLQKHQEFEAEVNANETQIQNIAKTGQLLMDAGHYACDKIDSRVEEIFQQWEELGEATDRKGVQLQQALSLVHFNRKVDGVQSLVRDRVAVASSQETGRDLEHCQVLMRKFDDFQKELTVDKSHLDEVVNLAHSLRSEGHNGAHIIKEHEDTLNARWEELISLTKQRKQLLKGAEQVHKFVRDASDTNDRMNEKAKALLTDDYGKDLASVEALIRRHDELERDLTAIENKLELLEKEATRLIEEQPTSQDLIEEKQTEIFENWEQLTQRADTRKTNLEQSRELQRFLADLRDLLLWAKDIYDRLTSDELAKSVPDAERLLELHHERKGEIDARQDNFTRIRKKGESLVSEGHYATSEIQSRLQGLQDEHNKLHETWTKREELFNQCYELQVFLRDAEQRDAWIGTQEAFLSNEDLGDNLDSVEALIKKHEDFEKTLDAQEEKMNSLNQFAQKLMLANHYDSVAIGKRRDTVLMRYTHLQESSGRRAQKLADSKELQQFLRDCDEAEGWLSEKVQTASDESYRDPTNLQSKLQKHQAFEAELSANKGRVDSVRQTGDDLIDGNHYASHEIEARIEGLDAHWETLNDKSADKGRKLQEAWEQQQFLREVEDIESWIGEMESQMASDDMGRDLISVNNLIKKHALLENDIQANQDHIDDIMAKVRRFREANHFQIDQIEDRGRELVAKYCQLEDPMARRHQQLEDSLKLHQFLHDVEDEQTWMREREPLASDTDLGSTLTGVQILIKKHKDLETELNSHESVIEGLEARGQELITSGHFASDTIRESKKGVHDTWSRLREATTQRTKMLSDSHDVQEFYVKASEAESWMKDKKPLVLQEEYGKDEDGTQALIKKHEAIVSEIEGYGGRVQELVSESKTLISRDHFDRKMIQKKQTSIESSYQELKDLSAKRHHRLKECKQLHHFNRECEEVEQWISEKEVVAANEELGKDLEHVEVLQKRFSDFVHGVLAAEDRVVHVSTLADTLLEAKHTESKEIAERKEIIDQLWIDLKDLAEARTQALTGAKEIHTFDRDALDTKERIQEKDAAISDDYGKDLASVETLQRRHEGFERDLAALKDKVKTLSEECQRLCNTYPESSVHVKDKENDVLLVWEKLLGRSKARKDKLIEAEQLQRFLNNFRDLNSWVSDMIAILLAEELPQDVAGAEAVLASHSEHKTEIDARGASFKTFKSTGSALIAANHYASKEIRDKLSAIEAQHAELLETWERRQEEFDHNLDVQMFHRDAEQAESWIALREAILGNEEEDIGDSVDAVEEMLKKQEDFEKMLAGQEEKFHMLIRETKVEETDRRKREEEEKRQLAEQKRKRELQQKRQREEELRLRREEEERRLKEEQRRKEEKERLERERLEAEERARKLEEERLQKLHEEEELRRQEREAKLFADLGAQGVPTFGLEEGDVIREGFLQRKNELDEGGRKAATRSWKNHYTVLIGPLLNFYKDKRDFQQYITACPPINVTQGVCEAAKDYVKRKNALRLKLPNGAEYLFVARDEGDVTAWVQAINSVVQGGSPASSNGSVSLTTVSGPTQSQVGVASHIVEPLPPTEPVDSSNGSKTIPDIADLPPEHEPPPLPSVPLPDEEQVTEQVPPPAPIKPHPSPSLPTTARHGQHRPAPPPPTVAPPTLDEAGKGDGLAKGGKRKSRFKMFAKK